MLFKFKLESLSLKKTEAMVKLVVFADGLVLLVAFLVVQSTVSASDNSNGSLASPSDLEAARESLIALCRKVSSMKHLSQVEALIFSLKRVLRFENADATMRKQSWNLMPNPMKSCIEDKDAILDLEEIIKERANVCKSTHLDKIEAYQEKWIDVGPHIKPKVTRQFFRRYANQVSFNCRRNLLHWLNEAELRFFSEKNRDYSTILPWFARKNTCTKQQIDGELMNKGEVKSIGDLTIEEKRCLASETLSVKSIGELVETLHHEKNGKKQHDAALFLLVPSIYHDKLDLILASCASVEPIFRETILPIVRLAQMDYYPDFKEFEKKCETERVIQEWFSITLICSSLLDSKIIDDKKYSDFDPYIKQKIVVIVDNDGYGNNGAAEAETQATAPSLFIENPIEDELFLSRYNPNRLSKIKESFFNKVFKVLKIEDVKSRIVFRKRVSDTNHVVRSVVLASLIILGLNS